MMDEPTPAPAPAPESPETEPGFFDNVDELFARLDKIDRALDLHRREVLLLWVAVLGLAGAITLHMIKARTDA